MPCHCSDLGRRRPVEIVCHARGGAPWEQPVSVAALGPIAQLGYVVDDVSAAMEYWLEALDVGPFFYLPSPPLNDLVYQR